MYKVKQAEKGKGIVGNKRDERELEMLLSEIPHMTPLPLPLPSLHYQNMVSTVSSSSFSDGFCSSSEDGFSPSVAQMEQSMYRRSSTHYFDPLVLKNSINNDNSGLDDLGLCENLRRMNIRETHKDFSNSEGFGFGECSLERTDYSTFEGFQSSILGNSLGFSDDMKGKVLGLRQGYNGGNLMRSNLTHNQYSNALYSEPISYRDTSDYVLDQRMEQSRDSCNGGFQLLHNNPYMNMNRPYMNDEMCCSRKSVMDFNGDRTRSLFNPVDSSELVYSNMDFSLGNPMCNSSLVKENGRDFTSHFSMTEAGDVDAFSCEDSFIIQGKSLKYVVDKGCDRSKGQKKKSRNEIAARNRREKRQDSNVQSQLQGVCENGLSPRNSSSLLLQPTCSSSLAQLQGFIYFLAKDQSGCRSLQKIFEEGTLQDVQIIFNELINHVVELMMNPFGNYLMQKLLEVCSEEQRMQIVLTVTQNPGDLVQISLNTHGTRVVQKLIETLKIRQQISLFVLALKPGFLDLIKDLNGYHVIQRCLECLSKEDNKFIFDAAAKFCVDIATHQLGCCILNQCIAQSYGIYREKLAAEIAAHGLLLAQDAFGNYVVQTIIELKIPSAAARLASQFEGHYVYLSMQKFSSHVVQKCLKHFEESRSRIIHELLSVPHFVQLLQDPFANYVIQSALEVSKGSLHSLLVEAVRPHKILRTSPYCKKIFSRNLLKK